MSKERFGKFSQGYVDSINHKDTPDLDTLVTVANPQKEWSALDIATGGGHTALKFAPYVKSMIATDLTPQMLMSAKNYIHSQNITNISFKIADAEDLPFNDAEFDLVTCRIAAHHFPHVERFISEAFRVLRPGGIFMLEDQMASELAEISNYINKFERIRDPSHFLTLSKTQWEINLKKAGFSVEFYEAFPKRVNYNWWKEVQDVKGETSAILDKMVEDAPESVKEVWNLKGWGTPECDYNIWQQIFKAVKKEIL